METPFFVIEGRETQLDQLQAYIISSLAGQPQIVFVTGDAGTGKTVLVHEACRRAQKANDQLIIAWGQCSAQLGLCDPYLPFKEILALLTGDTGGRLATRVVDRTNANRLKKALHYLCSFSIMRQSAPAIEPACNRFGIRSVTTEAS